MTTSKGFSLVELSIVLVILGLLVGGVLTGQSLIRAAELRSVTTDAQRYIAAVNTFRDKYFALPGDMTNATSFWGKDNTNCTTHTGTATTPGTCNGDGDGQIEDGTVVLGTSEQFQFWKQLALSGMIEGSYNGLTGAGSIITANAATNAPRSKISSAVWSMRHIPGLYGDAVAYTARYSNFLVIGGERATAWNATPIFRPEEAWNIDTKIDDGKPGTGKVLGFYWNNACATSTTNTDYSGAYKLTDTSLQCILQFIDAF